MRSVPAAMTWEIVARGKWHMTLAILGAVAFPAMILTALNRDGGLNPTDPSMLMMHTIMTLVAMLFCGSAIMQSQGKASKLYTYPLTNFQIVAWRMFPAMAIIAVQMAIVLATLNGVFKLDWPIWGPALAAAAGFAALTASLLLTENSIGWLILANAAVAVVGGLWFRSRYGGMFSEPLRYWRLVTPGDLLTMLGTAAASFWVANIAVARNRCGEPPLSLGILKWIDRVLESYTSFNTVPATAFQSQCRYEWERKGWAMPMAVALLVTGGLIGWYFGNRNPQDLVLGFLAGGGGLWMIGFIGGITFGNTGRTDADFAMRNFLATRPMSDTQLARAILRTAATSLFFAWLIWAVAFGAVCTVCAMTGSLTTDELRKVNWLLYPASLLGPWIVAATLSSILLCGRGKIAVIVFSGLTAAIIAAAFAATLLPRQLGILLWRSFLVLGPLIVLIGSPILFAAARRKGLVGSAAVWASATFWTVTVTAVTLFWPAGMPFTFSAFLLTAASLALAVVPFAAAPLAIAANRHR
jgi:hypothetical protein